MSSAIDCITEGNVWKLKQLIPTLGTKHLNLGLIQAAKLGTTECCQCLIGAGAEINFVSNANYTPLTTAIKHNKPEVVRLLLSSGCSAENKGGLNSYPLHIAVQQGFEKCVNLLLEYDASVNVKDAEGNTPIVLSAIYGHYGAMRSLLQAGCNINAANKHGLTALHYACHKARGFQVLLDAGADPDVRDNDNITPILMAASEGFDVVVKALVEAKCDVNIPNNSVKKTALHILSFKGHTECINALVFGGADINACDVYKRTPLWYAIHNNKVNVVRLLLKAYSHVDTFQCGATSTSDDCPARLAFHNNMFDVIKFFILTGYDHSHVREILQSNAYSDWLLSVEEFYHWSDFGTGAQTLKQLCRKWIRHHLGRQFYHHLQILPVPDIIKSYLYLEELHDH
ncbi:E3 ubiquitin-protein ligase MIB2-like [Dreissena polymorpha]|uniref:SOCS box domain-containing protein n=1 Tax=Dreissena polymorpha TaxID=45954 RepID=A0A9D4HWE8_DREPO|nr:E3 ubiquitin-protein ligase MIB2-like [Dreissena polymorpha]XP_052238384.1 E3 ubiquitin-protein ligase MIB2-like [Dreissena polymorpha]KAH3735339.1 hypothetical protein DPMN_041830 [Dreissena polymorpha]